MAIFEDLTNKNKDAYSKKTSLSYPSFKLKEVCKRDINTTNGAYIIENTFCYLKEISIKIFFLMI